jgi:hypothetical protein
MSYLHAAWPMLQAQSGLTERQSRTTVMERVHLSQIRIKEEVNKIEEAQCLDSDGSVSIACTVEERAADFIR